MSDPSQPLPPGCKDSGVTPVSSISPDGKSLVCNLGDQPEGTSGAIFPMMQVNQQFDNDTVTLDSTIETDQSGPVTSNSVTVTISAAPQWDWKKDILPEIHYNVEYNGELGNVVIWPIYLEPGGIGGRGIEPMNDATSIQLFDHLYYWSADVSAPFTATLITAANVANFANYSSRVCGGYAGSGELPYGVTISGTTYVTNTTQGVQDGTETITCTDLPGATSAAGYPVVQIGISGHNTQSFPEKLADGSNNSGVVIAAEIPFFITGTEISVTGSTFGYIHNAITGDTIPITTPAAIDAVSTIAAGSEIQVAGTSGVITETTTADNLMLAQLYGVSGGGGGGSPPYMYHSVDFNPGPAQLKVHEDNGTGLSAFALDTRLQENGGMGMQGLSPTPEDWDNMYDFLGEVARGQDFTLRYHITTMDQERIHNEAVHGCLYIDNTYVDVTEMPTTMNVMKISDHREDAATLGGYTMGPSHRQAHVMYGDSTFNPTRIRTLIRDNPASQPNHVIEFAKAAIPVGTNYDRHEVVCRQGDAADIVGGDGVGDWIDINDPNFDTIFNKSADGRFQGIEMVRLRTLEPVPWYGTVEWQEPKVGYRWGVAFAIHLNLRVKSTVPDPIDGTQKIYTHGSRATGEWDGIGDPPTPDCRTYYNLFDSNAPTQTELSPPNGFCNLATVPVQVGGPDPFGSGNIISHRDTVTIISSVPTIQKQNVAGLADLVDNGDTVTFQIDVGVIGADIATDAVTNIVVSDTLPAHFDFVGFVGAPSTIQNLETTATPGAALPTPLCSYDGTTRRVQCNFGDQAGGWTDTIQFTVRAKNGVADQALDNTAQILSDNRDPLSSVAFAYMIPQKLALNIRHEVDDLDGNCIRPTGVTAHVAGDCSVTDIDGQIIFTIDYTNTGNVDLENIHVIAAQPHLADTTEPQTFFDGNGGTPLSGITGDGRTPPSAFSGSISLASATDSNGFTIEHTIDSIATVDRNPATNSNTWLPGTALAATGIKVVIPTLTVGMTGTVTLVYNTLGNVNDDIYTSNFGAHAFGSSPRARALGAGGSGGIYVGNRSNDVSAMVLEVMVGSTVWSDIDNSGTQDAGEAGISGITVELYDPGADGVVGGTDDLLIGTTTTDANGDYLFDELHPGDYYVSIPTPPVTATVSSGPTTLLDNGVDGDDNGDQPSGPSGATYSPIITLDVGTEPTNESFQGNTPDDQDEDSGDMSIDFGFYQPVEIGNYVWSESDSDGDASTGTVTPIVGAVVTAVDSAGNVYTATTDAAGQYTITVAANSTYTVTVGTPTGYVPSGSLIASSSSSSDPDGMSHDGAGTVVTVTTQNNYTIDFGFTPTLSLGSTLFYDNDNNGTHGVGENGIPAITVELLDSSGTVISTTTTDVNGDYVFDGLTPGDYQVRVPTPPADAPMSSTPTTTTDNDVDSDDNGDQPGGSGTPATSPTITLAFGTEPTTEPGQGGGLGSAIDNNGNMTVDFGFVTPLSLGSTLFYDNNNDGLQGTGETGIAVLVVELLDSAGAVVATTTTDSNGDYVFDDLFPGQYQVRVPTPPSDAPLSSTPTSTTDDNVDGNDDGSQPSGAGTASTSPMITLALGTEPTNEPDQGGGLGSADDANGNMTIDFGFTDYVSLGSTVFYDNNDDGQQGTGETGIAGITIELLDTAGNVIATTTTDVNGDYLFDSLMPGDYQVRVPTAPSDAPTSSTSTSTTDDNVDGDDNGDQPGGAGTATTSPVISLVVDGEPTSETEQGGTQDATDDNNGDMTVDFGFVPPLLSLGSTLFYDNDNDGLQGTGESGIVGITVELLNSAGAVIATTTTDSNGDYVFDDLSPGDYQVRVPTPPADAPMSSTPTGMLDDDVDSDDNGDQPGGSGTPATSPMITLVEGNEPISESGQGGGLGSADDDDGNMTVDFGFVSPLSLGSTLFYDNDNSGVQDAGEAGIAGIIVELYDAVSNTLIATTTTDINGDYLFGELLPGDYQVVIPTAPADAPTSSTPTNMADDNVDGDDNGDQPGGAGAVTTSPVITLAVDSEPTGETEQGGTQDAADDDNGDMTVDFGFAPYVSLGSTVFHDLDNNGLQDIGDAGISGVVVELYDTNGTLLMTTTTDSNGDYYFGNLLPDDYQVVIPTPPSGISYSSTPTSMADDNVDGDDNGNQPGGAGAPATSPIITLTADGEPVGEPGQGGTQDSTDDDNGDMTIDFGFFEPVRVGDTVWYDDNDNGQQDAGEGGVAGVTVNLFDSAGNPVTDIYGNPVGSVTTDANGNYLFDELPPGDYYVEFDLSTLPGPQWYVAQQNTTNNQSPATSDQTDSDADPNTGQTGTTGFLNSGEEDITLDMGIVAPVTVGDRVWYDDNQDGIQDSGETGVQNVLATLYNTATGQPVTDQFGVPLIDLTDASGNYLFENLPPGDYYVEFQLSTLPNGYVITQPNQGNDDAVDSDADRSTGMTAPTGFLPSNTEDLTLDMGIYRPNGVSVGDYVWLDSDRDGVQDPGEAGVSGVTVNLVDSVGNPVTQDRDGNSITSLVTDANGNYLFDNLPPGDYAVVFDLTTLPTNHVVTSLDSGSDDLLDSDADPNTGMTPSTGPLEENEQDLSLDLGIYPAGNVTVGDIVWFDDDHDGVQDMGEAGVSNVTVNLFDSTGNLVTDIAGNLVGPATTDANGSYLFTELPAGDYYVEFDLNTLPAGYQPTIQDAGGNDAEDSDADPASGQTASTGFLNDGEEDLTLDMGIVAPVSVGDTVWYDNDSDGMQDSGESGVAGVTVELFDASGNPVTDMNGNPVGPATTDSNGNYTFDNLPPGDYYVQFDLSTLPSDYVPTTPNMGGNDGADSDANLSTGETSSTGFLSSGSADISLDMGIVEPSGVRVGDTVWYDDNINGLQDPGEMGVAGVTVELFDAAGNPVTDMNGNPVGPTTTDANGNYLFDNLPAGDYYVQFDLSTLPADSIITLQDATNNQQPATSDQSDSDADPTTGETATTGDLAAGEEDLTLDMGIYRPASIGDMVWFDSDADGVQDADESGIEGVIVELFNADGTPATDMNGNPMTTTTDSNGNYEFDDLYPGDYYVEFTAPTGYNPSPQDATNNQSPATSDQTDSDADPITGQTAVTTLSSGENDPTWDAGFYQPVSGMVRVGDTVWYDDNINGLQDPGEMGVAGVTVELFDAVGNPVTDMNGNPVGATVTDATGNYLFDNLPAGDYYVQFDLGTLPAGSTVTLQDVTNDQQPTTSDQSDSDADPTTGATATTGDLAAGEEDLTLDMGIYRPASIGDTVWLDSDADGVQDAGEVGIAGVIVELFNAALGGGQSTPATDMNGNPMTTTTDSNGNYEFDDLYPGDYYVEFTAPAGYTPSPQDAGGDDSEDSDADPITGQTAVTTLTSGENDPTWDAGFYQSDPQPNLEKVRVGDRVWYDNDGDGVQDDLADEPGVEGVTVTLYNADGTLATDLAGNVVAPIMTDANGDYLFDNLPEGDYYVEFDLSTLPGGYEVTEHNAGGDDGTDSDGDPNSGQTGTTGFLSEGSEDLTLDLGIVAPVTVGDRVWYDYDGDGTQDAPADEPGVESVTVILLNADGTPATDMAGNPVASMVTDSDGNYLFENLPPGDYQVMFDLDTLPGNHMVTERNAGSDDGEDSDGDPVTGLTDPTGMLMAGDEDLTLDLGILPIPPVEVGDTVWYDEDSNGIQDDGEEGVEGVTVMLFNADGSPVTDMDGNPVGPVATDSNGNYLFENLPAGDYYVQFDLTTLPDGYQVTEQDATNDQQPETSDQTDSDGDPDTGMTDSTGFLAAGSQDLSLDLGISPELPVTVGDTVWYDDNSDGLQDTGEAGVEDVTARLFNADGSSVTDMAGNPVGPTTTDSDGEYLFENLPPGDYFVQFDLATLPQHYVVTEANATNNQSPATSDQTDSDANTSTGETDNTGFLPGGSEDLTLDMGIVQLEPDVRVGDRVWLDEDRNGLQDPGEVGVPGVMVTLYDAVSGDVVGTTFTDADGNYLFDELFPGDYYVQFDLNTIPGNHAVTQQDATNDQSPTTSDQTDSDVSPEDGISASTGILFTGEEDMSLDMGIYPLDNVTVGDTVWYDSDSDGIQDAGELGVENVTVTLYDTTTGQPVVGLPAQQTNSSGNYLFEDLPAGDYYVVFDLNTLPDGYGVTEPNATNNQEPATSDQTDSDANPADGQTGLTGPLSGNQSDLTLDMGIVQLPGVTVGDLVWYDDNADGIQDPAEAGVAGVTVYLYDETTGQQVTDGAGEPLMQVTDGDGEYLFTDLPPGQYAVQFDLGTLPDDYVISPVDEEASDTADSDAGPDGMTPPTDVLAHGDEDRSLDMGIYKPVQVGDTVWYDDGNGQQDPGEEGVADVTAMLYDVETGEVVGTTTTDENGNYLFDNLPPGNYQVKFDLTSLPEDYRVTGRDMEGDDDADSDADPETGETPETGFLSSGEADLSLDMGIVLPVSIGDLVWFDEDMDGLQGADEEGVADVTVTLYDASGTSIATTTTDENGNYLFEGLPPGDYSVGFDLTTLPEGYVVTQANATNDQSPATNDQIDSDANPADGHTPSTGFLPSGSAVRDLDMGIHKPVKNEVRVGGQVWEDTDLDGETDPEEKLWPDITVELYSQGDPTTPIATAVTDENGNYLFESLPEGQYFTTLVPESLPEGALSPSYYSAGSLDDLRSNSDVLEQGNQALELDMALRFPASLSGLAWLDANGDGIRSVDEEILSDVAVELYDATGEKVGEMETSPDGTYLFDELLPGEYRINYVPNEAYHVSPHLQGEDDSRDSDIDPAINLSGTKFVGSGEHLPNIDLGLSELGSLTNLIWVDTNGDDVLNEDEAGIAGITVFLFNEAGEVVGETVTDSEGRYSFGSLEPGEYQIAFAAPDDLVLVTDVDAGELVRGPMISVDGGSNSSAIDIGFTQPSALGNYVWLDTNKDGLLDADEQGIAGSTVRLLDGNGELIESTTTDSDGRFEFLVAPGNYQLHFIPKDGMEFTLQNQGDDNKDSDVDTESGRTAPISIAPNQTDFSHFAGLIVSPTAIQLMSLTATETIAGVQVEWATGSELNTFGFQILRSRDGSLESAVEMTENMVLSRGIDGGSDDVYKFIDTTAQAGQVYSYWLVEVQNDQTVYQYGPTQVIVEGLRSTANSFMLFLPLIER